MHSKQIKHKKYNKNPNNKTKKTRSISGSLIEEKQGWKSIHIYGSPYERGYAHGSLLYQELKRAKKIFLFLLKHEIKQSYSKYNEVSRKYILPILKNKYMEQYDEMRGIVAGAQSKKVDIPLDLVIGLNSYMTLYQYFEGKTAERCSTFIATGSATSDGSIVMAHNTHTDFASGQLLNIVMKITPEKGHEFVMQTSPGLIASSSDWFITKAGIVGCESTISSTTYDIVFGVPYFCRIRDAMQYGNTLDDYANIMMKENAGDYPCSWLFGNINNNQIMLLELGLKVMNKQMKTDGIFYGSNTAMSLKLRSLETKDDEHINPNDSSGARNLRLNYLLFDKYYGKIDIDIAKTIISDHYDSLHHDYRMEGRSICIHYDNDDDYDYPLSGCTDGKVLDSALAKTMNFIGIFGSSCGRPLNIKAHVKKHPKYRKWLPVVNDFKKYRWVKL